MPVRFTGPIKNKDLTGQYSKDRGWFSNMPVGIESEPDYAVYFNDFLNVADYAATDWTVTTTEAGSGDATEAITADGVGGILVLTNDNADNDLDQIQGGCKFKLQSGKKAWFETRVAVNDVDQTSIFVGLAITDTTILDGTSTVTCDDLVGFHLADNDADGVLDAISCEDGTQETVAGVATMADGAYKRLGFYFDGLQVHFYVERQYVGSATTSVNLDEAMAITMTVLNGEAAANTLSIDYIFCAMER